MLSPTASEWEITELTHEPMKKWYFLLSFYHKNVRPCVLSAQMSFFTFLQQICLRGVQVFRVRISLSLTASLCSACVHQPTCRPYLPVDQSVSWHSVCALQSFGFDPRFSLCSAVRGDDGSSCLPAGTLVVFCFTKHSLGIRAGLV